MASVYILYSEKLNRYYVGSCKDISYRVERHLSKDFPKSFTTKADDWSLFFFIDSLEYAQARKIEQHIKNIKSKIYIQNIKKYPEISQNLIAQYS